MKNPSYFLSSLVEQTELNLGIVYYCVKEIKESEV